MAIINYGKIENPPKPYVFIQDIWSFEKDPNDIEINKYANFSQFKNKKILMHREVIVYKDLPHQYFLTKEKKIVVSMSGDCLFSFFTEVFFPVFYLNKFEPTAKFIIIFPSLLNPGSNKKRLYIKTYLYLVNIFKKHNIDFEIIEPDTEKILIKNFYVYKRKINDPYIGHDLDLPKQLIDKISHSPNPTDIIVLGTDENNFTEDDINTKMIERFSISSEELSSYNIKYFNAGDFFDFKEMLAYLKNVKVAIILDNSTMIPFLLFMPKGSMIVTSFLPEEEQDKVFGWLPNQYNAIFSQFMKIIICTNNLKKILDNI